MAGDAPASVQTPATYRFPHHLVGRINVVWSSEPGVDLHSRPAEVVRATTEAGSILSVPGPRNYPGAEAAAEDAFGIPGAYTFSGDRTNLTAKHGTLFVHLASLSSTRDSVHALVCAYNFGLIPKLDEPKAGGYLGGSAYAVDATRSPDAIDPRQDANRVAPIDSGDRAPRFDAFEPWQVVYRSVRDDPRMATCLSRGREIVRSHPAYRGQVVTEDTDSVTAISPRPEQFPVLPQSPEWPPP
ncbi:Uncharacterised protein [Gordonia terrae]|nr:Uncharacterised protein [Clostridioides difficile]VTS37425.1 Uncharacterised protein [Gordonia terrae]